MNSSSITDVSVALPEIQEVLKVLTFRAGFNSAIVVFGTTCLGVAAGLVGTFSLLRKRSLMGDALAHSALPGLATAYIVAVMLGAEGRTLPVLLFGALVSGILGVLTVQFLVDATRLREDTAIGAVLSIFFGLGIVLLSAIQSMGTGSEGGLHHFIYGQTAALNRGDAIILCSAASVALVVAIALLKEFRLLCFDPEYAAVQGWPVRRLDLFLMGGIVVITVIGLQAVGLLLVVALLIVPAAAARFWTEKLSVMVTVSGVIGGLSGYIGAVASSIFPRFPAGAVIVLVSGVLFLFSMLCAPERGLIAGTIRHLQLRLRIAREHFLRKAFEQLERKGSTSETLKLSEVSLLQQESKTWQLFFFIYLERTGLLRRLSGESFELTAAGLKAAQAVTRNHRLWEEYLVHHSGVQPSHVDYSADLVEHVLSPEIVHLLEETLERRLNPETVGLKSVHPIES